MAEVKWLRWPSSAEMARLVYPGTGTVITVSFLINYETTLLSIRQQPDDAKGKGAMYNELREKAEQASTNSQEEKWLAPPKS
uniref:Uncharacterized protein n=1 Tax=Oryza punctata TaxID=4537 RepID=A0A0E0M7A4_ORYPU